MKRYIKCSLFRLGIVLFLVPLGAVNGPEVLAGDSRQQTVWVLLNGRGSDFALVPSTGALAVIDPDYPVMKLYPSLATNGITSNAVDVAVGPKPFNVLCRTVEGQELLFVLCDGDHTLYRIDPKLQKITGKLPLAIEYPRMLAAPAADSMTVAYYVGRNSTTEVVLGRVNLEAFQDDGLIPAPGIGQRISVANDGRHIYSDNSQSTRPVSWVHELVPDLNGKLMAQLIGETSQGGSLNPDPYGCHVASDSQLFGMDLYNQTNINGSVCCFLPDRPFFFTLTADGDLAAISHNTLKPVAMVKLDPPPRSVQSQGKFSPPSDQVFFNLDGNKVSYPTKVLYDGKRDQLLVYATQRVTRVPLTAFNLPPEPLLLIRMPQRIVGTVGQLMEVPLFKKPHDAAITLKKAPRGVKLQQDKLVWTPVDSDVGIQELVLTIAAGGVSRDQVSNMIATRPKIELDFTPTSVQLTPDGSKVLALLGTPHVFRNSGPTPPTSRLVLIDRATWRVEQDHTIPFPISIMASDGKHVYLAERDADAIQILSIADLRDVTRVFTKGMALRMTVVGNKTLYLNSKAPDGQKVYGYSLPGMKELRTFPMPERYTDGSPSYPELIPGVGWYQNGILRTLDFDKTRLLIHPITSPMLVRLTPDYSVYPKLPSISRWGVVLDRDQIRRVSGQVLGRLPIRQGEILTGAPAILGPEIVEDVRNGTPFCRVNLTACSLADASVQNRLILADKPQSMSQTFPGNSRDPLPFDVLESPGKMVIIRLLNQIIQLPMDTILGKGNYSSPMVLEPETDHLVIASNKPSSIALKAQGGTPPFRYSLKNKVDGFTLDEETGVISVDPDKLKPGALEALVSTTRAERDRVAYSDGKNPPVMITPKEAAAKILDQARAPYGEIIDQPLTGAPVLIPVTVSAVDSRQQVDELSFFVVFGVEAQAIEPRLQKAIDEFRAKYPPPDDSVTARAPPPQSAAGLQKRIEELEAKQKKLEGQVELLIRLLNDKTALPSGKNTPAP